MAAQQAVAPLRTYPPRLLLPTDRADLRLSWHPERDEFILSLWHGDVCVGSAPLTPQDAAEVSSFVAGHLGERVVWGPSLARPAPQVRRHALRELGGMLEGVGGRLQRLGSAIRRR